MRGTDRREALLRLLREQGHVNVTDAAGKLGVDRSTVRRDLSRLEDGGLLRRDHGIALPRRDEADVPINVKVAAHVKQKQDIAAQVAAQVPNGSSLMLDSGSTSLMIARALEHHRDLTVVTNDVWVAAELITRQGLRLILPGGESLVDTTTVLSPDAVDVVRRYHVDLTIIGADAVDAGCATNLNGTVVPVKRAMMAAAARRVLVVDSSKLGQRRLVKIAPLGEFDEMVTDDGADDQELATYPITITRAPGATKQEVL